jgi:hypothetical protein
MALQGLIGAFDTVYYHEWRAKLPARGRAAVPELILHACRDFLYAVLFGTLPWWEWHGRYTAALALVLAAEIVLTLWDFVVEVRVRQPFGDVYGGERVTHAVMGILYGSMLACLVPDLVQWWNMPTALLTSNPPVPEILKWALTLMAFGVFASGIRDLYAACGMPKGGWPWKITEASARGAHR